MLRLSNSFLDRAILSLRIGGKIGNAHEPIINPNNLRIEGWHATGHDNEDAVLPVVEVRDFIVKGIVVNDYTALTPAEDMVRLKDIIELHFDLMGMKVITDQKRKLGKISDYAVDDSYYIQNIYVTPTLLKSLTKDQLIIGRKSIVEINDEYIIVKDSVERQPYGAQAAAQA